tara:strand:+ start:1792 stop:2175 length:384 start_codon:yes stop_codon:yes gene_type:complete
MDKTTTWLIRGASLVIIVFGSIALKDYLQVKRAINSTKDEYLKQQEVIEKCESIGTLRYSNFIQAVQQKKVSRIIFSPSEGRVQVYEKDGKISWVNVAPDQELLELLAENNVDVRKASSNDFAAQCK